jgi:hypothetical protein
VSPTVDPTSNASATATATAKGGGGDTRIYMPYTARLR